MITYKSTEEKVAEHGIIASLITDCITCWSIAAEFNFTKSSFSVPAFGIIFEAIKEMVDNGVGVDTITLCDELCRTGHSDLGVLGDINKLTQAIDTTANFLSWAKIVNRAEVLRGAQTVGLGIADILKSPPLTAKEVVDSVWSYASSLERKLIKSESFISKGLLKWDEIPEDKGVVATGFTALDRHLDGGYKKTELNIVAARPGVGKTTLAINFTLNALQYGLRVVFVSLEMSEAEIKTKMLCNKLNAGKEFVKPWIKSKDPRAMEVIEEMKKYRLKLWADDGSNLNSIINKVKMEHKVEAIDLLVIDYIGLIQTNPKHSLYEKMTFITQALKQLAMSQKICVIGLAQLNRDVEKADREPMLSDLRDSGSIEQDANSVLFIHRDKQDKYSLVLRKNRNGTTGAITCKADHARSKIVEASF